MRIVAVRERTIELSSATRNSSIGFDAMTASVVAVHTDVQRNGEPLIGLSFDSVGRYGHGGLLRERFIPRLLAADPDAYSDHNGAIDPHRAWSVMMKDEKPGGHGERSGAVGMLDAALWDLAAKAADAPLWSLLAQRHGAASASAANVGAKNVGAKIAIYASGGHYRASNDIAGLCDDLRRAIGQGHRRFKIKIGGASLADDIKRIEAVFGVLERGMSLAVDGNGTFDREKTILYLEALKPYPIAWIEEPVHPLDFDLHRDVIAQTEIPLATGENLFSRDDARNLIRYGGLRRDRDILQFDISLCYGIVEYLRILDDLDERGWRRDRCAPHAGHLLAMNAVAGLGLGLAEVAMDTSTLFGKLTANVPVSDGTVTLSSAPGTGFEQIPIFSEVFSGLLN
jgi:L-alanine-DL-glutamate epimerase-like enolase superfamily enzyme